VDVLRRRKLSWLIGLLAGLILACAVVVVRAASTVVEPHASEAAVRSCLAAHNDRLLSDGTLQIGLAGTNVRTLGIVEGGMTFEANHAAALAAAAQLKADGAGAATAVDNLTVFWLARPSASVAKVVDGCITNSTPALSVKRPSPTS